MTHISIFHFLLPYFHSFAVADTVSYGRYRIMGCGPTKAKTLTNLLSTLQNILPAAISDAESSPVRYSGAFNTFFHNSFLAGQRVADLLTNINLGTPMYPTIWNFPDLDNRLVTIPGSPTFICASEPEWALSHDPEIWDYFYWCRNHTDVVMDYQGGSQFITVCPQFWSVGLPMFPKESTCLSVNRITERFRGSGAQVSHFMIWIVLEELAHFYINAGRGNTRDVSAVNDCVKLRWRDALRNAANYMYYVASKSPFSFQKLCVR